jgi:hypothetical protein
LTVDLIRKIFATSVDLATAQRPPFSNPIAGFELLAVADHHGKVALKLFPAAKRDLEKEMSHVKGLEVVFLCKAVDYHFGKRKRLAEN